MFEFKKADKKKAKLRLAITGPSGSGKTFSALLIAKGIGGKVAVIDTENHSASLYANNPTIAMDYCTLELEPPYSPERCIAAVRAAYEQGFDVVIFDSLSHAWSGPGGLLEMVDAASKGLQGNSFAAWKNVRPQEKQFLEALIRTDIHIIATMRTKTEWVVEKDSNGKSRPRKVGLKPEQKEGLEYEFTVVLDMVPDGNIASASKDRTDLFRGKFFVPDEDTGKQLLAWLEAGSEVKKIDLKEAEASFAACKSIDALNEALSKIGIDRGHPDAQPISALYRTYRDFLNSAGRDEREEAVHAQ